MPSVKWILFLVCGSNFGWMPLMMPPKNNILGEGNYTNSRNDMHNESSTSKNKQHENAWRSHREHLKEWKPSGSQGYAPNSAGGAYSAPHISVADGEGASCPSPRTSRPYGLQGLGPPRLKLLISLNNNSNNNNNNKVTYKQRSLKKTQDALHAFIQCWGTGVPSGVVQKLPSTVT